jgi:hypothetical protein
LNLKILPHGREAIASSHFASARRDDAGKSNHTCFRNINSVAMAATQRGQPFCRHSINIAAGYA